MKQVDCIKCENTSCIFKNSHSSKWLENSHYKNGQHIFIEDMSVTGLYVVQKGIIQEFYTDKNGIKKIRHTANNGEIFGHKDYSATKHAFSAIAIEDSQICLLKKNILYQVCKNNSELSLKLMNFFVAELNKSDNTYKHNFYNLDKI